MDEGRRSRGYLPHIDGEGLTQFVTFHLADALPQSALEEMRAAVAKLPEGERKKELGRRVEAYCDAGEGECQLRDPRVARLLQEKLFEFHDKLYRLHAWCVMPNHGHVLLTPRPGVSLATGMQRIKGGSSFEINRLLKREGRLWQPESYDVWIRDETHFYGVRKYIEWNPVKAKIVRDPVLHPWSSANQAAWARFEGWAPG